jgi:hypothetical protein
MRTLPDPRHYVPSSLNPLVRLAQQRVQSAELAAALRHALDAGDDMLIDQALAASSSYPVFRVLSSALDDALKAGNSGLQLRLFAIPILIVAGGLSPVVVPGVVPAIDEIRKVFESHGTLGPMKNFGLSTSLVSAAELAAIRPSVLYQRQRASALESLPPLDLPPQDLVIERREEQVYLRFLTGVSLTSADAPGFAETAGDIGAWGMSFTRALGAQLAQPGLSLLPIPRGPASPRQALEAGTFALCELSLQLFLSNGLRKFRSSAGEADAAVFACDDASVRIRLSSPFDTSLSEQFAWQLEPGHDMAQVSKAVFNLLDDCRVQNIQVGETVRSVSASH